MSMSTTLNEKVIPAVMKFVNLKPVVALKDGILFTLPLTLVGSVFLLLAQLPIPALNEWIASIFGAGWTEPLFQAYNATFKIIALVATMGIAYSYAKNEDHEPLSAGIIAFVVFILTSNLFVIYSSWRNSSRSYSNDLDWRRRYGCSNYNWSTCRNDLFMVYGKKDYNKDASWCTTRCC